MKKKQFIATQTYVSDEIVKINEPKQLFGQIDHRMTISASCVRAKEGLFDAS